VIAAMDRVRGKIGRFGRQERLIFPARCGDNSDMPKHRSIEWLEPEFATMLRAKTGAQRLAVGFRLHRFATRMLAAAVQSQHPDWSETAKRDEVAKRLRDGAR